MHQVREEGRWARRWAHMSRLVKVELLLVPKMKEMKRMNLALMEQRLAHMCLQAQAEERMAMQSAHMSHLVQAARLSAALLASM